MKCRPITIVLLAAMFLFTLIIPYGYADADAKSTTVPEMNNGRKWRIGYCESEPYSNFAGTLYGVLQGLEELGWIENLEGIPYEAGQEDSRVMWKWLASHYMGRYIQFVDDAYYCLASSEKDTDKTIIRRLKEQKDIDLMLAMGTYAGKALAIDQHKVPVMVLSTSNAVQSGIIKSEKDSGLDHVWAHVDPDRYIRQLQVFHDMFNFKKLGVVYENSPEGRTFAAISDVEKLAGERGFEVIAYPVKESISEEDRTRYYSEAYNAYLNLSEQIDAMYITAAAFREQDKLRSLLKPFYDKKIPVFSQQGDQEVRNGALFSLYRASFKGIGQFTASNIAKILNGIPPRELPQVFGETPSIALNMKVAEIIDYKVPFDILLIADKLYFDIGE